MNTSFQPLIQQYKAGKESVCNTWFITNEEQLKLLSPAITVVQPLRKHRLIRGKHANASFATF